MPSMRALLETKTNITHLRSLEFTRILATEGEEGAKVAHRIAAVLEDFRKNKSRGRHRTNQSRRHGDGSRDAAKRGPG